MTTITTTKPPKATTKLHVCFSFAAYAKTLTDHLRSLNVQILPGLTDHEFASIESNFGFTFPPDLRAILQEGLPFGSHFPNWRSSQQAQLVLNLPKLNLTNNVAHNNFWVDSWGIRPQDDDEVVKKIKFLADVAPVLVPVYGNCYIPCTPNSAGNPVFFVDDKIVRIQSYDISRFFQEHEFLEGDVHALSKQLNFSEKGNFSTNVPAWAATSSRRVSFWSDVAENGRRVVEREDRSAWWRGGEVMCQGKELNSCLEEVFWRLRDGGWTEEEVRDMMMDGCDREMVRDSGPQISKQNVGLQVRGMSRVLSRAGWSKEDVVDMLDLHDDYDDDDDDHGDGNKTYVDFEPPNCFVIEDDHHLNRKKEEDDHHHHHYYHKKMSLKGMMQLHVH